jgi:6-phosphogluconate dehydrogenase (decarboxylating)
VKRLEERGEKKWRKAVFDVIERLQTALESTDVVVGGGNTNLLENFSAGTRHGDDMAAFAGGFRLWTP